MTFLLPTESFDQGAARSLAVDMDQAIIGDFSRTSQRQTYLVPPSGLLGFQYANLNSTAAGTAYQVYGDAHLNVITEGLQRHCILLPVGSSAYFRNNVFQPYPYGYAGQRFSMCARFKVLSNSGNQSIVSISDRNTLSQSNLRLYLTGMRPSMMLRDSGGANFVTGTTNLTNDFTNWHMMVGTYDGTNAAMWVDGVRENLLPTGPVLPLTDYAEFGRQTVALGNHFEGYLIDIVFWSRVLHDEEILTISQPWFDFRQQRVVAYPQKVVPPVTFSPAWAEPTSTYLGTGFGGLAS